MKLFVAKYLFVMSFILLGITSVQAVSLQFQPIYEDARFEPANVLHAGCLNSADILVDVRDVETTSLEAELQYDPNDLDILRVENMTENLSYELSYESVYFAKESLGIGETKLFRLYFKSNDDLTGATMNFVIGDKVQKIIVPFSAVPECQPDVIPPTINLVSPKNEETDISLDSSFVFDLKDNGKGIDRKTISVYLDGILYDTDSKNLDWSGSQVVVYPDERLPVGQELMIDVSIADNQKYGGSNVVKKQFKVVTSTGVLLDSAIEPDKLRGLLQGTLMTQGTSSECALLQKIYSNANIYYQYKVRKILNKLSCEIPEHSVENYSETKTGDDVVVEEIVLTEMSEGSRFSVFCVLGWLLFVITLVLKLYYFVSHKKYKMKEKVVKKRKVSDKTKNNSKLDKK